MASVAFRTAQRSSSERSTERAFIRRSNSRWRMSSASARIRFMVGVTACSPTQ